jgi:hypothetical protein
MDEHAEDPVGLASQKVVQYASLASVAAEAIAQVRQQRAAAAAATDARAVAAARAERTAALTVARPQWQPMLDGRLYGRTSVAEAGLAWAAAQGWREVDPQAALASDRALERLRELRPDVMERFDRLTGDGLDPVEAMRRVAPFLDRPPARPGEHAARAALSAGPASASAQTAPRPRPEQHARPVPTVDVDLRSSASRQHYIDTGQYLSVGEAVRADDHERGQNPDPTAAVDGADAVDERMKTAVTPTMLSDTNRDSHWRNAADLARDGFPEPLTAEVLAAGRVRAKAPDTTAPAAVRSVGLATAARAASRTR